MDKLSIHRWYMVLVEHGSQKLLVGTLFIISIVIKELIFGNNNDYNEVAHFNHLIGPLDTTCSP